MTIVVEDGTGLADAQSFVAVDPTTAYLAAVGNAAWAAATNTEREQALVKVTRYVEASYEGMWRGVKRAAAQALSFPRDGAVDEDGYEILGVPDRLKRACYELAPIALAADLFSPAAVSGAVIAETKRVEGVVTVERQYSSPVQPSTTYKSAHNLIVPLLTVAGRRLHRV